MSVVLAAVLQFPKNKYVVAQVDYMFHEAKVVPNSNKTRQILSAHGPV
jgi:hypothetical protein